MEQMLELLKDKTYQIPRNLFVNYKKIGMTEIELVIIIYLLNSDDTIYNPKKISNDLGIELNVVLEIINGLTEKGIINLEIIKVNNIRNEIINLDLLYEKLAFILLKKENKKESTNLFDIFEKELGRTLSPMEYEIINGWLGCDYTEELIVLALKEAIYNGVSNFRYIDRIIYEWNKKGIKTKEDIERNRKEHKKSKENNQELFDYDWLNESTNK